MKKYSIARLNKVATILKEVPNGNFEPGSTTKEIGPVFYGNYQLSIADTAALNAEGTGDTRIVAVRHDDRIDTNCQLRLADRDYRVTKIQPDDELNGFDLITINWQN